MFKEEFDRDFRYRAAQVVTDSVASHLQATPKVGSAQRLFWNDDSVRFENSVYWMVEYEA